LATFAQLQEQSEKIGELQIELTLAHSRNQQVVEQLLAAEAKCHALQEELDTIFTAVPE
jgi:argininosuccinate lyase